MPFWSPQSGEDQPRAFLSTLHLPCSTMCYFPLQQAGVRLIIKEEKELLKKYVWWPENEATQPEFTY